MKSLLLTISLAISIVAFAQKSKKNVRYNHFKTFYVDLNNENKIDTIILSSSLPDKSAFNRISISMSGAKKATFKAKHQWAEIQPEFLSANKNMVQSKHLFIKKTNIHTVIIVSGGEDGAGYGEEFSIINIEHNNIKMVFDYSFDDSAPDSVDVDIEIPAKLIDIENNKRLCFIYSHYNEVYKKVKGGMIGTYQPYYVFPVADNFKCSDSLTKAYNIKHYIYVDHKHLGEIEIFYPNNPKLKPSLWR